ncbi:MAG: transposase [Candidatus Scalindua sp.]|nr:transposase [Candidatus Scalindua sp.]
MHENYQQKHCSKYATRQFVSKSQEAPTKRYLRLLVSMYQQLPGGTKRISKKALIKFLKRLIREATRKIFLILDNLKVHHSYVVRDWWNKHKEQLEVFFLPSYSPELNPDEYLNSDLKVGVHSQMPAKTKEQHNISFEKTSKVTKSSDEIF